MKEILALSINGTQINPPNSLPQPGQGMPEKVIGNALDIFIITGIVVCVIMITWAGIQWSTSGGDKQKLAAARAKLTWAIIGVVVMLLAFGIVNIFSSLFGINLLNLQPLSQ